IPGFLHRVLSFAVPCGIIAGATTLVVYGLCRINTGLDESRTAASTTLFCIGWWVLVVLARPYNWWRLLLVGVMPVIFLGFLTVPVLKKYYEPVLPHGYALAVTLLGAAGGMVLIEVVYRIVSPLLRRRVAHAEGG
ncbi:MAG: hypothetical protein J2P17_24440, partial [Mycobacterium sp.]|nr:hypothetical protein [Mycobacterium sp.]